MIKRIHGSNVIRTKEFRRKFDFHHDFGHTLSLHFKTFIFVRFHCQGRQIVGERQEKNHTLGVGIGEGHSAKFHGKFVTMTSSSHILGGGDVLGAKMKCQTSVVQDNGGEKVEISDTRRRSRRRGRRRRRRGRRSFRDNR